MEYLERVINSFELMKRVGHKLVIVKRAVIGSKDEWKPLAIFKSKVFRDWSIINIWKTNGNVAAIFETTSDCFC